MPISTRSAASTDSSPAATGAIPARPASAAAIWAALASIYVIWGSTYLAIRFAVETLPPFFMAGARFLLAGAVLYIVRRMRGDPAPTWRQWRSAAIVGLFMLLGGNGGVVWAEQRIDSGIAAVLVATVPLWMVLIDLVRRRGRRPGRWAIAGVVTGFAGIVVLIGPQQLLGGAGDIDLLGVLAVIWGAFSWTIGSLYSRDADLPASPLLGTGMEMLTGGAGLSLLGMANGEWGQLHLQAFSARSLGAWAYLVVFGSWVGFAAYTWLLRAAPTPLVSTYAYVNPLVAVLLGHFLAEETLTLRTLVAAVIIVGSVALITTLQPPGRRPHRPNPVSTAAPERRT